MKRILALLLVFALGFSLVACDNGGNEENVGDTNETDVNESDTNETTQKEDVLMKSGIMLTDALSFVARDDAKRLESELTLDRVVRLKGDYIRKDGGYVYFDLSAPYFEIGGISHNEGTLTRLPSELLSASKYYENSAGVTVRFATSANKIKILATFKDAYKSNTTVPRGSCGIDIYVGSGTDRDYCGARMQKMTGTKIDEVVELGDGVKEVLINLPMLSDVVSFEIGFNGGLDGISAPLKRDHAPIVFYGGAMTQGLSASRPGNAYANIVGRMLNADTINLGVMSKARGDAAIAEYIAGIGEISAFVLELDDGASADELRANHYNFYKTVRDAHPDIPIIIMNTPTYSEEATNAASERREVILETYKKALEAGDRLVYFLDANSTFPHTGDLLDIYTGDMQTASDTGMYAVALGVYDVLNSAFTPDTEKSGVERLAGGFDKLSFESENRADELAEGEYVKVGELEEKYGVGNRDGKTFLSMSAPCFTFGGIEHPDDNGGMYHRIEVEKQEALFTALAGANSGDNLTAGSYRQTMNHLTGGTIRFRTNAKEFAIKLVSSSTVRDAAHFSNRGSMGIDIYVGSGTERYYVGEAGESYTGATVYKTVTLLGEYTEVLINLPLYGGIKSIEIGLDADAEVAPALERAVEKPVLLYGASVTQGACASRPGLAWATLVSRMLDVDVKSLACSGLGWAESAMAEYIAGLDISAIVLDCSSGDWPDRIDEFYRIVRAAHPDIPLIYTDVIRLGDEEHAISKKRVPVVREHCEKVWAEGDENVYFLPLVPEVSIDNNRDLMAVDFCHPNDLGMYYMAETHYAILKEVLGQ